MTIENKIVINNIEYVIGIELYYDKKVLCKKSKFNNYFDCGDFSILLKNIEENYSNYIYDKDVLFMNNVIYIYDNIPFVSYIKEINKNISTLIYCNEIEKYIFDNNIKLNKYYLNSKVPLLFD